MVTWGIHSWIPSSPLLKREKREVTSPHRSTIGLISGPCFHSLAALKCLDDTGGMSDKEGKRLTFPQALDPTDKVRHRIIINKTTYMYTIIISQTIHMYLYIIYTV